MLCTFWMKLAIHMKPDSRESLFVLTTDDTSPIEAFL